MRRISFLLVLLCLFATAGTSCAAIYKWVDENGTIIFRDTPPPKGTKAEVVEPEPLSKIEYDSGRTPVEELRKALSEVKDEVTGFLKPAPPAVAGGEKIKAKKAFPEVELYVTSWCGYCARAKAFLQGNGVPFKIYNVEQDSRAAKRHRELNPRGGVPVAVIGERIFRGFSPEMYSQALGL